MKIQFPWQKTQYINACLDLYKSELWEDYECFDVFVVKIPNHTPLGVMVLGSTDDDDAECGIHIFRGADIFGDMLKFMRILTDGKRDYEKLANIDVAAISMVPYSELDGYQRKWFKACNFQAKKDDIVPLTMINRKGSGPSLLEKDSDIKQLLYIIKGLTAAFEQGLMEIDTVDPANNIFTIDISGDIRKPDIYAHYEYYKDAKELLGYRESFLEDEDEMGAGGFEKTDRTYVIVPLYEIVEEDGEDKPVAARLVVMDEQTEEILADDIVGMSVSQAVFVLNRVFAREGLPEKVVITAENFFEVIEKYFEILGVDAVCDTAHNLMGKAVRKYGLGSFTDEIRKGMKEDSMTAPGPGELRKWATMRLATIADFLDVLAKHSDEEKDKLAEMFFDDPQWRALVGGDPETEKALALWFAVVYRETENSRTVLEQTLAGDITPGFKAYLESLNKASVSLYKIEKVNAKERLVTVKDVWGGDKVVVNDAYLSSVSEKGEYVPLWVYRCGDFNFADIAGPSFDAACLELVMDDFTDRDMPKKPDKEWLRENVHIFGGLWSLFADLDDDDLDDDYDYDDEDEDDDFDDDESDDLDDSVKKAVVEKFMHDYYMNWIDTPLPVLDNKTPRQSVKTPQGAAQVMELIQNMPVPTGQFPVKIPKFEMLSALGLI